MALASCGCRAPGLAGLSSLLPLNQFEEGELMYFNDDTKCQETSWISKMLCTWKAEQIEEGQSG